MRMLSLIPSQILLNTQVANFSNRLMHMLTDAVMPVISRQLNALRPISRPLMIALIVLPAVLIASYAAIMNSVKTGAIL